MSKPPLIIPNRRGTTLWPAAMQIPTAVQYSFDERGTDGWTGTKEALARAVMSVYAGPVKQFYVKQTSSADLSSTNYVSFATQIMPGLHARYRRNFMQATLHIHIEVNVVLANPEIARLVTPLIGDYAFIQFYASEESGWELDTLTGFVDPARTPLGWASQTMSEFRDPGGPEGGSIVQGTKKSGGGDEILRWYGDFVLEEFSTVTLAPFKDRGQSVVEVDLYAYWYDVKYTGAITIIVELIIGKRPVVFNAANIVRDDRMISSAYLQDVIVEPEWLTLGEVAFVPPERQNVQLVARLRIDMSLGTVTLTKDDRRSVLPIIDLGIPYVVI